MHLNNDHSDNQNASTEADSSQSSSPAPNRLPRRSFLRNLGMSAVLLAPGAALLGNAGKALAADDAAQTQANTNAEQRPN